MAAGPGDTKTATAAAAAAGAGASPVNAVAVVACADALKSASQFVNWANSNPDVNVRLSGSDALWVARSITSAITNDKTGTANGFAVAQLAQTAGPILRDSVLHSESIQAGKKKWLFSPDSYYAKIAANGLALKQLWVEHERNITAYHTRMQLARDAAASTVPVVAVSSPTAAAAPVVVPALTSAVAASLKTLHEWIDMDPRGSRLAPSDTGMHVRALYRLLTPAPTATSTSTTAPTSSASASAWWMSHAAVASQLLSPALDDMLQQKQAITLGAKKWLFSPDSYFARIVRYESHLRTCVELFGAGRVVPTAASVEPRAVSSYVAWPLADALLPRRSRSFWKSAFGYSIGVDAQLFREKYAHAFGFGELSADAESRLRAMGNTDRMTIYPFNEWDCAELQEPSSPHVAVLGASPGTVKRGARLAAMKSIRNAPIRTVHAVSAELHAQLLSVLFPHERDVDWVKKEWRAVECIRTLEHMLATSAYGAATRRTPCTPALLDVCELLSCALADLNRSRRATDELDRALEACVPVLAMSLRIDEFPFAEDIQLALTQAAVTSDDTLSLQLRERNGLSNTGKRTIAACEYVQQSLAVRTVKMYGSMREYATAITLANRILADDPSSLVVLYRARVHESVRRHTDALSDYTAAIRLYTTSYDPTLSQHYTRPMLAMLHFERANCYEQLSKWTDAIADARVAIQLTAVRLTDQMHRFLYAWRGYCRSSIGFNDADRPPHAYACSECECRYTLAYGQSCAGQGGCRHAHRRALPDADTDSISYALFLAESAANDDGGSCALVVESLTRKYATYHYLHYADAMPDGFVASGGDGSDDRAGTEAAVAVDVRSDLWLAECTYRACYRTKLHAAKHRASVLREFVFAPFEYVPSLPASSVGDRDSKEEVASSSTPAPAIPHLSLAAGSSASKVQDEQVGGSSVSPAAAAVRPATPIGAFLQRQSLTAYTRALLYKYLADRCGIECRLSRASGAAVVLVRASRDAAPVPINLTTLEPPAGDSTSAPAAEQVNSATATTIAASSTAATAEPFQSIRTPYSEFTSALLLIHSTAISRVSRTTWLGRTVALKELQPVRDGDVGYDDHLFQHEAKLAAEFVHPNVVRQLAACDNGNGVTAADTKSAPDAKSDGAVTVATVPRYALITEFVAGGDLYKLVRSHNDTTLPLSTRIWLLIQLGEAISAMHARTPPIIHRDIKPGNALVTPDTPPVLKVTDFGLSRHLKPNGAVSTVHNERGTPHYMAPEQANGEALTPAVDVYAFGGVIFFMLYGIEPWTEAKRGVFAIIGSVMKGQSPPRPAEPVPAPAQVQTPTTPNAASGTTAATTAAAVFLARDVSARRALIDLMTLCHAVDPTKRPVMWHVLSQLYDVFEALMWPPAAAATAAGGSSSSGGGGAASNPMDAVGRNTKRDERDSKSV